MATLHIQSGRYNIQTNSFNSRIQSVPFKIYADCDAKVSKYFDAYVKPTGDDDALNASFRGYPLQGRRIALPNGYSGLVLHESMPPDTDKDDRKLYVIHTFNSFTYWNWNKLPSRNDAIMHALDWIDVAEALHSPVVEE